VVRAGTPSNETTSNVSAAIGLALWLAVLLWAAPPWGGWSVSDDWAYSDSVRLLLEQGRLRIPELAFPTSLSHILWGALWCLPGGFSVSTLRLSSLAASAAATAGMFAWLAEFGAAPAVCALGAAALAFCPVFVGASYTFFTDVPFLALLIWSLWAYRRGRPWLGSALAALAYLSRQSALAVPLAAALELRLSKAPRKRFAAVLLLPLAAAAGHAVWFRYVHGVTSGFQDHAADAAARLRLPGLLAADLIDRAGSALQYLSLAFAPMAPLLLPRAIRARRFPLPAAAALSLLALAYVKHGPAPNLQDQLSVLGLGFVGVPGSAAKASGWFAAPALWLVWNALGAAAVAAAAARTDAPNGIRFPAAAAALFFVSMVIHGPLYDRYFLVLFPAAAAYALAGERRIAPAAWALAAGMAAVSALGARDFVRWNQAVDAAASAAGRLGARPEEVSAGLAWDGAHTAAANIERLKAAGDPFPTRWWGPNRYKAVVSFDARPPQNGFVRAAVVEYETPFLTTPANLYLYVPAQKTPLK
jgi:hypothetical protein